MTPPLLTLLNPTTARAFYDRGLWCEETLYMVVARHAAERPDAYALRDRRHRLTWAQLKTWVDAVAADLHAAGLAQGDRVAIWLPSRVETLVTFLACSRNGYVGILSLHQNHTVNEVSILLERCGARAFAGQPGYGADAAQNDIFLRLTASGAMRRIYALEPLDRPEAPLPEGAAAFPQPASGVAPPPVATDPDKVVYIAFTSGTTGQPKALMHSDNTLLANGRAMVEDWGHGAQTILYCLGPLSHHLAIVGVEQALAAGCEYVTNDLPKGTSALDRLIETGATYVMGVPTHAIDIQQEATARGLDRLGAVEVFYMSGASIAPEVARRFLDYGVIPQNTYGMTEGGTQTTTLRSDSFETMVGTVGQGCGRANPCYELKVFRADDHDTPATPGDVGELGGRGAALMLGYFANQDATEAAFNRHGWLMSGDLARTDQAGNIVIVGRAKDIIIRGGHNIYPVEIESLVLRHPDVAKAAAFPMPDARLGEKVCLAVIPTAGRTVNGTQLLEHLAAEGLSKFDMPEYFMAVEALPMTAGGKILKRALVEQAKAGEIEAEPVRYRAPNTAA
ncbi:class I adenylate-forming enzyme family protein [Xanthobacter autotrophicus DSM 431]|uniref:class I adenylate-forming enzyme family protein n=1 Tax=Xanthobacter nonsaccharivorans TaxID=3119912 RepID=UPI003729DF3F